MKDGSLHEQVECNGSTTCATSRCAFDNYGGGEPKRVGQGDLFTSWRHGECPSLFYCTGGSNDNGSVNKCHGRPRGDDGTGDGDDGTSRLS